MVLRHVWLVPVAAALCAMIGMIGGYVIGVANGHLLPLLPFISDGGAQSPEASIFGQFLNLASFFYVITFYIRHRQTVEYYYHRLNWEQTKWRYASLALMYVGFVSALGLSLVANFREYEIEAVHNIGALMAFIALIIYAWGQVIIGYALIPRMATMLVNHFRLLTVLFATCCLILHELALQTTIFVPRNAGAFPGWQIFEHGGRDSPYFRTFLIATSSEWALALALQLFLLTFVTELRFAYAHAPRVIFKRSATEIISANEWTGQS
ncbi:unnamed protein product [Cylicocyclus nassatus]|uniref:CWH43-like N-terminal domain-containing protein n=1 Tax=Cylicocyclus nassatus TaxID=53992 RepID=A0AA36H1A9_CYLNA|nr:unnamed protein product [Cylicocyclus nassatus]